ncbi:MAG: ABC transporter permease [Williamsia sp.]|nr:ABC transporter permease [Williamsia sp.]
MRTLRFILQKEFKQIFRNPAILRIILAMPVSQLFILPWAADYETKGINLSVVDQDHSPVSSRLLSKITASGYFKLASYPSSYRAAAAEVEKNQADIILQIPAHFEKDLVRQQQASLFLAANSINGTKAVLGSAYLQSILADYNNQLRQEWTPFPRMNAEARIQVLSANWYNPRMNYRFFMVPGILVVLVTMIGCFLAAMNIVREKEIGTIEQINVTPIRKHHFIIGKLVPFWVIGLVVLSIGMFISWALYGIVPAGSFLTIYLFSGVYLLAILGLGLLVSTVCSTQQQAMLVSFFLLMTFILLGGLFTPIESMPNWARWLTRANPVAYFIDVTRRVILKGSSLRDIMPQLLTMLGFAVLLNGWAVLSYRKTA